MTLADFSSLNDSVISMNKIPPETSSRGEDVSIVGISQQKPAGTSSHFSSLLGTRTW